MGRRWLRVLVIAVAAILVLVPAGWLIFRAIAQPGGPPAFYDPPDTLPDGPPGTIVRADELDEPEAPRVWRIMYTSTGMDGSPIAVSGIIAAPDGDPPAGGRPLVAWAHGTTGVASRCVPSLVFDDVGLGQIPELGNCSTPVPSW